MLQRIPVDLTVPSCRALSYVLRRMEHWPAGFGFDYCSSCAMDLAYWLWQVGPCVGPIATALKMPEEEAYRIFMCGNMWSGRLNADVTPEMVADQIDLYLAREAEGAA